MNDTPRTDAQPWVGFQRRISPEFCRTLERELAVVTAERNTYKDRAVDRACECVEQRREIARLNRDLALAGLSLKTWVSSFDDMTSKRDALAAKLAEAQAVIARANPPPQRAYECLTMLDTAGMGHPNSPHGNTLTGMVKEICERLSEAQKDTERLDWMETQTCWIGIEGEFSLQPKITAGGEYKQTIRAAIDTARTQQP